ncbi:MAG: 30S ribosomal protein S16 [Gammaproteobacteria bacterium RIFCSPHIGHO2_12_FULL_42_13]|nr:MAG: 30S ribosomal protein S16 [Gammaproteobacteria bacterium RIFCSPHIGHO2_12_FULL_42_13]
MLVIRLARAGVRKSPFYHVVAADSRRARGGRFIERLGFYNPMARGPETTLQLNLERIEHWISKGAQPSPRVSLIIKTNKKDADINKVKPTKSELKTAQIKASESQKPKKTLSEETAPAASASEETKPEGKSEVKSEENTEA